jgi:hypothetical protein
MFLCRCRFEFCKFSKFPHFSLKRRIVFGPPTGSVQEALAATRQSETFGRVQIVNRLVDAMVYGGTVCHFEYIKSRNGCRQPGFWAFGSVGTLAIGLASKDK